MNRNLLWAVIKHFDRQARSDRCPHCGMATGGYLYGAKHDGYVGEATGGQYREGQQMHPTDSDICMCDRGMKFVG